MEITEQAIHQLAMVATEVQTRFVHFTDLTHGWEHTHRIYHLALHMAEQEHADGFIVGMAALLHDLGRTTRGPAHSHAERSAKLAAKLLAPYDLAPETQHAIRHAILAGTPGGELAKGYGELSRVFRRVTIVPELSGLSSLWVEARWNTR